VIRRLAAVVLALTLTRCEYLKQIPDYIPTPPPASPSPSAAPAPSASPSAAPIPSPQPSPSASPTAPPTAPPTPRPSSSPTPSPCPSVTPECEPCSRLVAQNVKNGHWAHHAPGVIRDTGSNRLYASTVTCEVFRDEGLTRPLRRKLADGICDGTEAAPAPCTSPSPVPSAPASPGPPAGGVSDVAKLIVLHYDNADQGCKLAGQPFVIPAGCKSIHVTATPKQADGKDAIHHGRRLTWTANGIPVPDGDEDDCVDIGKALVCGGLSEPKFNRTITRKGAGPCGVILLEAKLIAPDDRVFTAMARRKVDGKFVDGAACQ
jgi:hypothetical protein